MFNFMILEKYYQIPPSEQEKSALLAKLSTYEPIEGKELGWLAFSDLAHAYLKLGRHNEALEVLDKALGTGANLGKTQRLKAIALGQVKSEPDAYNIYTTLIEEGGDVGDLYWARGVLLSRMERFPEALEDFGRCLEAKPNCP